MRRFLIIGLATLGVWACGQSQTQSEGQATVDRDTLTRRQKDSIVSTMPIPGASGIGRAQRAADRARERAAQLDSIR